MLLAPGWVLPAAPGPGLRSMQRTPYQEVEGEEVKGHARFVLLRLLGQ